MAGDVVRLLGEIFRFTSAAPRTYFNGHLALWPIRGSVRKVQQNAMKLMVMVCG